MSEHSNVPRIPWLLVIGIFLLIQSVLMTGALYIMQQFWAPWQIAVLVATACVGLVALLIGRRQLPPARQQAIRRQ